MYMRLNPFNHSRRDGTDKLRYEIISQEPTSTISFAEKSPLHKHSQDSVVNLEFEIKLKNGQRLILSLGGVFDTMGGFVSENAPTQSYGSEIAVNYIRNRINKYLEKLAESEDINQASSRLKDICILLLQDIHEEIVRMIGIDACGNITAVIKTEEAKHVVVANCGDTRSYFFMPNTPVSPHVPTLDHSAWLYEEFYKIKENFKRQYPDAYRKIVVQNRETELDQVIFQRLKNFQAMAYSDQFRGQDYAIQFNTDLTEGVKHPSHTFFYKINTSAYYSQSNQVLTSLGSSTDLPAIDIFTKKFNPDQAQIVISCSDGVYEILSIEMLKEIVDKNYDPNDPLALSKIQHIIKNEVRKQILLNAKAKKGIFVKVVDDYSYCIFVI